MEIKKVKKNQFHSETSRQRLSVDWIKALIKNYIRNSTLNSYVDTEYVYISASECAEEFTILIF